MKRIVLVCAVLVTVLAMASAAHAVPTPTVFLASINKTDVTYDSAAVFKGTLKTDAGARVKNHEVWLLRDGVKYRVLQTDSNGNVQTKVKYWKKVKWQWKYPGDGALKYSYSSPRYTQPIRIYSGTMSFYERWTQGSVVNWGFIKTKNLVSGHTYEFRTTDHAAQFLIGYSPSQDPQYISEIYREVNTFRVNKTGPWAAVWHTSSDHGGDTTLSAVIW